MDFKNKRIKKFGTNFYYITKDKQFFIKEVKHKKLEKLKREFFNLKKINNELNLKNLNSIEPVDLNVEKKRLTTRYIDAEPLINVLNPEIYYEFGKKLREFHKKGYSHSHLEFTDVLYKNGKYFLTDLSELNKLPPIYDIIGLNFSIMNFKLKRLWFWIKYSNCFKAFLKGYRLKVSLEYYNLFKLKVMKKSNRLINKANIFLKIRGLIFKIMIKSSLIKLL